MGPGSAILSLGVATQVWWGKDIRRGTRASRMIVEPLVKSEGFTVAGRSWIPIMGIRVRDTGRQRLRVLPFTEVC